MKKYLLTFLFSLLFLMLPADKSYAATLYNNDFKSTYTGFKTDFGVCMPTPDGLMCNVATGVNQTAFTNLKCVRGEYTLNKMDLSNIENNIIILNNNQNLNNLVNLVFKPDRNIILNHTYNGQVGYQVWDTGIATPLGTHEYTLCQNGSIYTGYLDGTLLISQTINNFSGNYIGFQLIPGDYLTNFTATDTLPNQLDVPLLKQTAEPWQDEEYDTAQLWNPANPTIHRWGCAMTSAAMVFKYHGIHILPPDDKNPFPRDLNPGTLNDWFKGQPDGYVRTGWLNWLALSRLSKQATTINNITDFEALEYKDVLGAAKTQLTDDLNNRLPGILEVPGHFVVATGINGDTFDINDPYYDRKTLNEGYNNTFTKLGRYVPSHTDLSYIMLVTDPDVDLTITDSNGNSVGESFVQSPIVNPLDNTQTNSATKIYYLPKPDDGEYVVKTSGNGVYTLDSYLYDKDGNPQIDEDTVIGDTSFTITFSKTNNEDSSLQKTITFASTIQDIKRLKQQRLINNGLAEALIADVKNAERQSKKHPKVAQKMLEVGIQLLNKSTKHPWLLSNDAYEVLHLDFTTLQSQIN